jgi:NADH dehydrogenase (ubiquinone) 1 alpha subcomplex subunit 9
VLAFGESYKTTIGYGPPGRAADSMFSFSSLKKKKFLKPLGGHVATVFGCTGFLGRYLVHKLGS